MIILNLSHSFMEGWRSSHTSFSQCVYMDKSLRAGLSERQIDKMIEDSFPASDPPSTY